MPTNSTNLLTLALLASTGMANARNSPAPELVPGLDRFDLAPRAQPTPVPRATFTPRPTATPTRAPAAIPTAAPTPTATRAPVARATPTPTPTPNPTRPVATPTPIATPEPLPVEIAPTSASLPAPSAVALAPPPTQPTPAAPATRPAASGMPVWPIVLGGIVVLLTIAGALAYRRRRAADRFTLDVDEITSPEPLPPAQPFSDLPPAEDFPPASPRQPDAPPSPAPRFLDETHAAPRASLELTVRPIRAGTNLTSAAVDYEIDIRNAGEVDAADIRLDLRLLSASADQDRVLTALYAAPVDKPIVAPFAVAAGEQVSLGGMAMLPHDAITILSMQGREFFVPLFSVNLVYGWGDETTGQTAIAHVIGIERTGSGKMAPFRLDAGPRMYDGVGARAHTLVVKR